MFSLARHFIAPLLIGRVAMNLSPRFYQAVTWVTMVICCSSAVADPVPWRTNINDAMRDADRENKLVLIHFWDHGCPPCLRLEKTVFQQAEFAQVIQQHYIPVKINVSDSPRLRKQYRIRRWPTDIILNTRHQQLHRDVSKQSTKEFLTILNQLANPTDMETPVSVSDTTPRDISRHTVQVTSGIRDDRLSTFPATDQPASQDPGQPAPVHRPRSQLGNPIITDSQRTVPGQVAEHPTRQLQPALPTESLPVKPRTNAPRPIAKQPSTQTPRLGLDGYCPVTLAGFVGKFPQWQKGDPRWGAFHRGQLYLFAGLNEQQEFLRNPDRYSPIMAGSDIVRLTKHSEWAPGDRRHGVTYRSRVYLFANEYSLQEFRKSPHFYAREAVKRASVRR
jgi:YHS domain-containing protein/thiol-disulfide isomerase/thioredoxin